MVTRYLVTGVTIAGIAQGETKKLVEFLFVMYLLYCYYALIDYIVILTTKLPNCQTSRNQISGARLSGKRGLNVRGINCRPPASIVPKTIRVIAMCVFRNVDAI